MGTKSEKYANELKIKKYENKLQGLLYLKQKLILLELKIDFKFKKGVGIAIKSKETSS